MKAFPGIPVGLSDHTTNNNAAYAAMALGAKLIERHFTDTLERKGPDIICSMDEKALSELIPLMLGGTKEALPEEQVTIDFAFATLVTIRPIKKGERFTKDNLWAKRPGAGSIRAERFEEVLQKTATQDIPADTHIEPSMIQGGLSK